jgi:N-methylhydantoinase B
MLQQHEVDPFTIEIIQRSLVSICGEMFAAMRKTAMSAIIYEVLDMATGIIDADGNLASSGAGIPLFMAGLDKAAQHVMAKCRKLDIPIDAGDVFVTNDPYHGGVTHLNDVIFLMPVFVDGELIAWTGNIAHWNDIGGMVPGSISTIATEIFQEGLRIPAVKLIARGELIRHVFDIITVNSRMPDFLQGDLWAGIAAVRLGERRLKELGAKYGKETLKTAMARYLDYGEQITLAGLRRLPKGEFYHEEEQDNGATFRCKIGVEDDAFTVDITGNPQDPGPFNISRDAALVSAQLILKAVTDSSPVCNGGNFRPLKLITEPGSRFHPIEPAAQGNYYEFVLRLYDLLWRCLARHMPERLPSGHYGSMCAVILGGKHIETGRTYSMIEPELGGWGADRTHDGATAVFTACHGATFNCPAEITEARNGFLVDRMELNPDHGGEGRFRGGKGILMDYRIQADECFLTCCFNRSRYAAWGSAGGLDGSPNYVNIIRSDGSVSRHAIVNSLRLGKDDVVRIVTGNGGGYGRPEERPLSEIEDDIRNGYLTKERASSVYHYRVER